MSRIFFSLAIAAGICSAQESITTVFLGLTPTNGMDKNLAEKYTGCLQGIMQSRGAITFIDNSTLDKSVDLLLSSGADGCDLNCQSALARSANADHVIAGSIEKNQIGFKTTLQIAYADSAKKPEKIDWIIVGKDKDLLGDGCKNGGGVIYNYLATPEAKVKLALPEGYNYEKVRDQAINRGDVYKLVEQLRAKEARDGAMDQKNKDGATAGGEKRR